MSKTEKINLRYQDAANHKREKPFKPEPGLTIGMVQQEIEDRPLKDSMARLSPAAK